MTETRITRLEELLAHQSRMVEDLSDVVRGQADRIDRLERRVQMLLARAAEAELDAGGTVPMADQKPPHY